MLYSNPFSRQQLELCRRHVILCAIQELTRLLLISIALPEERTITTALSTTPDVSLDIYLMPFRLRVGWRWRHAFNSRCDVTVATVVAGDDPVSQEQAVLEFLNGDLVVHRVQAVLGL